MSAAPRVSVIVPVYDVERYLEQCLASLAAQTLDDIEVLIVNDSSPDASQVIVDRFVAAHPGRFRAFLKPNGGLGDARNFGLERARGEFVAFVDSDDYLAPDMLRRLHDAAVENEADVVVSPIAYVRASGIERRHFAHPGVFGGPVAHSPAMLLEAGSYAWNKLFRRSLWSATGLRFPVGQWFEDSAVVYNVMLAARRVAAVDEPFYHYRRDREGAISTTCSEKMFDIFLACRSLIDHYASSPHYPRMRDTVMALCMKHVFARIDTLLRCDDRFFARRFADAAFDFLDAQFPDWRRCPAAKARPLFRRTRLKAYLSLPLPWRDTLKRIVRAMRRGRRTAATGRG